MPDQRFARAENDFTDDLFNLVLPFCAGICWIASLGGDYTACVMAIEIFVAKLAEKVVSSIALAQPTQYLGI